MPEFTLSRGEKFAIGVPLALGVFLGAASIYEGVEAEQRAEAAQVQIRQLDEAFDKQKGNTEAEDLVQDRAIYIEKRMHALEDKADALEEASKGEATIGSFMFAVSGALLVGYRRRDELTAWVHERTAPGRTGSHED